jgi:hypothetical protein
MATTYKQKLFGELNAIPEEMIPRFYRIIHALCLEFTHTAVETKSRGSLKGIWGDIKIEESLIKEARNSLFTYEREIKG